MINEDFSRRSKFQDVGRWYINNFVANVARKMQSGQSILDAGAGEGVYKKLFSHCDYKAIDLAVGESKWNYENLDYVGELHNMPIEDSQFDAVLCTQVLEHLEWPRESVAEMFRVLKPGGTLYMSVPMAQNEHQTPYDFFRYTSYGLRSVCKNAGFENVKISPFGGMWVRWAYEIPRALSIFPSTGFHQKKINFIGVFFIPCKILMLIFIRIFQSIFFLADKLDKKKDDPFGWACEATKNVN